MPDAAMHMACACAVLQPELLAQPEHCSSVLCVLHHQFTPLENYVNIELNVAILLFF